MSNYIYCNGELYHYGVKGMKWGVRRSPEVQAVSKRYKEELKPHRKELNRKNSTVTLKKIGYETVLGERSVLLDMGAYADKRDNIRNYKQKKKDLQEKYEPEFKKAQSKAEKRLADEKAKKEADRNTLEAIVKRKAAGKKAAIGAVATIGGIAVATLIADYTLTQQYGVSPRDIFKIGKAAVKL